MRTDQGGVEQSGIAISGRVRASRRAGVWGRCAAGLLLIVAGGAAQCAADVIVLAPVADNTMFRNLLDLNAELSSGVGDGVYVGRTSSQTASVVQRGLIRFDLSSLPCGATVTGVSLTFTLERGNNLGATPIDVHRMSAAWGEGASNALGGSGAPSTAGDPSWVHRVFPNVSWTNWGGDFSGVVSATTGVPITIGQYSWSGPGMIADVNAWIAAPATNFGWILVGDEFGLGSARKFSSREAFTEASRPFLTIEYTPGTLGFGEQPADASMCLSQGVTFDASATGGGQIGYRWQVENAGEPGGWEDLSDGAYERFHVTVTGSHTAHLSVSPGTAGGSVDFAPTHVRVVASNACGSATSGAAVLQLCRADVNCDHTIDLNDFFDFFNCWDVSGGCAEIDGVDGIDLGDFFAFFNAFDTGC